MVEKLLLITSIPWCLVVCVGVVVAFRDRHYKNRNISANSLGGQVVFSIFSVCYSLAVGAWFAASIWGVSVLLTILAIYISGWNRKRFLSSLG